MKKFFIACMLMMAATLSVPASAALSSTSVSGAGFDKLNDGEKAEIIKMVADKAASKDGFGGVSDTTVDNVDRWVKIGSNIGMGLAGAAKEVGVTVNEFATTPVGQMTTLLIVWHMIGVQLIHLVSGILIWIVGFFFIRYTIKHTYPTTVIYSKNEKNIFGNYLVERVDTPKMSADSSGGWLFAYAVVLFAGLISIFSF